MKKVIIGMAMIATVAGCTTPEQSPRIGMSNPASDFCIAQGGRIENVTDKDGAAVGLCHLPDGTVVEEWSYFRANTKG